MRKLLSVSVIVTGVIAGCEIQNKASPGKNEDAAVAHMFSVYQELLFELTSDKKDREIDYYVAKLATNKGKGFLLCPKCGKRLRINPNPAIWKRIKRDWESFDEEKEEPAIYCPSGEFKRGFPGIGFKGARLWLQTPPKW